MSNMNDQQLEAVMSSASKILVLAGAGTGKTYVMINRIKRLVDEGADPVSILALTFTNAAAFEMKERYHKFQEDKSKGCPEFKTFHAFCYSLLVKDIAVRKALGYSTIPSIVDESTMKRTIKEVKQQCNITLSDKQLEHPDTVPNSKKFEYEMFHKAMKQRLLKDSIITFDMLADSVCSLFIKNDPLIQTYIDQYKYIFIDEFQDTDPLQWKFAQCFYHQRFSIR